MTPGLATQIEQDSGGRARPSSRPVVRLEGVSKVYPNGTRALEHTDLVVHPGEFIVVVGPSGAGKSTMLRCINLLVRPTEGRLIVEDEEIRGQRGAQLRRVRGLVGMIFQQFGLVGRLSVLDNVLTGRLRFHAMPAWWGPRLGRASVWAALGGAVAAALFAFGPLGASAFAGIAAVASVPIAAWVGVWCWRVGPSTLRLFPEPDRRIAASALQTVGIAHLADRRADQLSGGQQQRVAIARTLAQEPRVILADEPIASLDPVSASGVMDALAAINRERGIPVVVNLHQVDVARRYATRIVGMSNGRIVFDGPPSELTDPVVERIYKTFPADAAAEPGSICTNARSGVLSTEHTPAAALVVRPNPANAAV